MSEAVQNLRDAQARALAVRLTVGGFPYLAETLRQAGVGYNRFTVAAGTSLFRTGHGDVIQQSVPLVEGTVPVPAWRPPAVVAAIGADQAGQTRFEEFLRACWVAGVVHYEVDSTARTCTYHGARPDQHYIEHYPQVALPDQPARTT
jgi:uncharacterized protein YbcV (DUF1398 family)